MYFGWHAGVYPREGGGAAFVLSPSLRSRTGLPKDQACLKPDDTMLIPEDGYKHATGPGTKISFVKGKYMIHKRVLVIIKKIIRKVLNFIEKLLDMGMKGKF